METKKKAKVLLYLPNTNYVLNPDKSMTEIFSILDISLFGYYQMFTFANIGPVLDNKQDAYSNK